MSQTPALAFVQQQAAQQQAGQAAAEAARAADIAARVAADVAARQAAGLLPSPTSVGVQVVTDANNPSAHYKATVEARRELARQQDRLEEQRQDLTQQWMNGGKTDKGLEQRIAAVDARILVTDKLLEQADGQVAKAAAVPGAIVPPPPEPRRTGPNWDDVFAFSAFLTTVIALPLVIAYARRIWRRGAAVITANPKEFHDRFTRIEQSLDTIAIEVERVGESQRFLTRMQADQAQRVGAGPAERIEARAGVLEREGRR